MRGAFNFLANMSPEARANGVICASAGNHAQGVAMAARHLVSSPITWVALNVFTLFGKYHCSNQADVQCLLFSQGRSLAESSSVDTGCVAYSLKVLRSHVCILLRKLVDTCLSQSPAVIQGVLPRHVSRSCKHPVTVWGLQGCSATICMPPTTTPLKIDSVRRLGAEIELVGATYAEAQVHAQMRAAAEGKVSLNPLNPTLALSCLQRVLSLGLHHVTSTGDVAFVVHCVGAC